MKKGLSLLLSLLMVISMFSCLSVVANAYYYYLDTESIESIDFEFVEGFRYIEDVDGYTSTDDNGEKFTRYYTPNVHTDGNVLILNYKDGSSERFEYSQNAIYEGDEEVMLVYGGWVSEYGGDVLTDDNYQVYLYQDQDTVHWGVGLDNLVTIDFWDFTTTVSVPIEKNPVDAISFTPARPDEYVLVEGIDGHMSEEYFYYVVPSYEAGDKLTVTYNDGRGTVEYVYTKISYYFCWIAEDGHRLDESDSFVNRENNQYIKPWTVGENYITFTYMGRSCQYAVTVVENPIESIEYTPATAYEFVENLDGYWDERYNEEIDEYEEFFYYQEQGIYNYDNALTVNYIDGSSKTFVYGYAYDEEYGDYRSGWFSADGYIASYDVSYDINQKLKPWVVGGDNYFTVKYMGRECKVPVTIKANTVESIEFIPKNGSLSVFENTNGYWKGYWDNDLDEYVYTYFEYDFQEIVEQPGNAIKVNYTDDTMSTYYYNSYEDCWIDETNEILDYDYLGFWANQYEENCWTIGENSASIEYCGKSTDVTVKVMEPIPDVTDGIFTALVISETECHITGVSENANVSDVLTIPEKIQGYTVTGIDSGPLYTFWDVKEINLPSGFNSFSTYQFNNCEFLEKVNVAEDNKTFKSLNGVVYNKAMTKIVYCPPCFSGDLYIPADVEELDGNILVAMGNASSIIIDENNPNFVYEDGIIYNADYTEIIKAVSLPENYVMKSTVEKIGAYAFSGNATVKNATVSPTVTEISYCAFLGCSALESVALPEGLVDIGYSAFKNSGLRTINFPSTVKVVDSNAFNGCSNLSTVSFNEGLEEISSYAFEATGVTSVKIPDSVTRLGYRAFRNCDSLTEVVLGKGVIRLDEQIFSDCDALIEFNVPSYIEFFPADTIESCSKLERIVVAEDNPVYSSIDGVLFNKNASGLLAYPDGKAGAYTVPSTVTRISGAAFEGATKLTSVVIPDSVLEIGYDAFDGCSALNNVKLSENITEIQYEIFSNCTSLQELYIPAKVTWIDGSAFRGCSNLKKFSVADDNTDYSSQNGMLYSKDKETLILCPKGLEGQVVVPQGTKCVANFVGCEKITSVVLPEGIDSISGAAFSGCTNLTEINLPESITFISYMAFDGCSSLETIKLPSQVTEIIWNTFDGCTSLKAIEIPANVTYIDSNAFRECDSLVDVYFTGTEEQWNAIKIENGNECLTNATIHFNSFMPDQNAAPTLVQVGDTWYYMAGNKVISDYTGLVNYYDTWYYVENGVLNWNYTGLTNYYNVWYYVSGGVLDWNYTGLTEYYGTWYYVSGGVLDWNYTGLAYHYGSYYYVENGILNWNYTGLAYHYGSYYYVENGILNWNYTGLAYHYGSYYYVENGILNWNYTGLAYHYGSYYYVENGILNWNYTGLAYHYGSYYYVENGILNWNYTGLVYHYGSYYYVENGVLNWIYTGLVYHYGSWYYVAGGVLDWGYTGYVNYYGTKYYITGGYLDWSKQ